MRKIHFVSKLLSACLIAFGLFGCSSPSVTQYANEKPNLDLSEYFKREEAWPVSRYRNRDDARGNEDGRHIF